MSSKKLTTPADLTSYATNKAYIRIFKYTPLNQLDHLICLHGDRGQGTSGEVAHLKITEAAYNAIAAQYPIAERESNLYRSEFFAVGEVLDLVQHHTEPVPAAAD